MSDQKKEETMPSEGENSPEAENNNKKSKTGVSQDSQPSPLALLAATCSKIGTPGENQATGQQIIIDPSQGLVQLQNQPQQLELVTTQLAGNAWQLVAAAPPASKENNVQQTSSVTSSAASPSSSNNGNASPSKTKPSSSSGAAPGQFQVIQVQNPGGSVQYQVIPQIQTTEGQQIQISPANATTLQDLQGQIQLIPAGNNQAVIATTNRTASGNIIAQNLANQTVPVQIRPGVSIPLQLPIAGTQAQVVTSLPINIGGVTLALPVINVAASSGSGQVTQPTDSGVSNGNQLISTPVTTASVSSMPDSPSTCTTTASTSLTSSETLASTAEAGQYASTANSCESATEDPPTTASETEAQNSSQLQSNGLQNVQDQSNSLQQVQIVGQPILQQIQIQQPQQQIIQAISPQSFQLQSGQTIQAIQQQPLQNVQLQAMSPTQVLIRAPTLTPSGQISWQTVQVQNLQSLSNLQVQNAGLPQQLTITPVSSSGGTIAQIAPVAVAGTPITLNAAQIASVPNLQTVSVANLGAAGVQVQGVPVTITSVAEVMNQGKRNNISAILKVVEKYMVKHLISGHTFAGILENDHLFAIGSSVGKDLQGVMSCRDIDEPTQVRKDLNAQSALKDLCEVTISPSMSKPIKIRRVEEQPLLFLPQVNWTLQLLRFLDLQGLSQLQQFLKIQTQQLLMFQQTWKNFERTLYKCLELHLSLQPFKIWKWACICITEQEIM
ncbi:transcription factor Sp4 isoform X2 [Paroedura picta]|uniref:transcription factor Sp4 isoform X2 n=1 Tax=Paroedura picta TaxID=143630 RepID=UPI00405710C5